MDTEVLYATIPTELKQYLIELSEETNLDIRTLIIIILNQTKEEGFKITK